MGEISIPSKMWRILCNVFFVFGVNLWQVYIFFSLSAFCLGWTKINIGQTKIPIFYWGWVFFQSTLFMWFNVVTQRKPWQKRLTGRELLFLPFRRNMSLRSGQQNTLWLSVITALSGSLGWWTTEILSSGPRGCSRIDANLGCRTLLVATRSVDRHDLLRCHHCLGNEEKKMAGHWMKVKELLFCQQLDRFQWMSPFLWWVLKTHLFWGLNWYVFSTSFGDVETGETWTLHHLGRALVEVHVEE